MSRSRNVVRRTPAQRPRRHPEQDLQRAIATYLTLFERQGRLFFFHVPNGGKRGKVEAAIFKALGVKPGVADLVILIPRGRCCFVELKADTGKLTETQEQFRHMCSRYGFEYAVVYSLTDMIKTLQLWGVIAK